MGLHKQADLLTRGGCLVRVWFGCRRATGKERVDGPRWISRGRRNVKFPYTSLRCKVLDPSPLILSILASVGPLPFTQDAEWQVAWLCPLRRCGPVLKSSCAASAPVRTARGIPSKPHGKRWPCLSSSRPRGVYGVWRLALCSPLLHGDQRGVNITVSSRITGASCVVASCPL